MSNNPYANFTTSESVEIQGIILEEANFEVRIRRAGGSNKQYSQMVEKAFRPYRRALDMGNMDNDQSIRILAPVFVETVILNWATVTIDPDTKARKVEPNTIHDPSTGEVVPATKELIEKTLVQVPELFRWIREQSANTSLFLEDIVEGDVKN